LFSLLNAILIAVGLFHVTEYLPFIVFHFMSTGIGQDGRKGDGGGNVEHTNALQRC
jgi:hypothetical protein